VSFNKAMIVVFWDDRSYPTEYQIADLGELLRSNRAATIQQEVALAVALSLERHAPSDAVRPRFWRG
jgi:hypothetical protein